MRYTIPACRASVVAGVAILLGLTVSVSEAQYTQGGVIPGKPHSLKSTVDSRGTHNASVQVDGIGHQVECISAGSLTNPRSPASCYITAPGVSASILPLEKVPAAQRRANLLDVSEAGTVTLECNGQGNLVCEAIVR
jgi:hypothetical protein